MKMKSINIRHRYTVTRLWVISFMAVIFCSIVFTTIAYFCIDKIMVDSAERYSNEIIGNKIKLTEEYVSNVVNGVINISHIEHISEIADYNLPLDSTQRFEAAYAAGKVRDASIQGVGAEERFVYLPKNDMVLVWGSLYSAKEFFEYSGFQGDYKEWSKQVLNTREGGFYDDRENDRLYYRYRKTIDNSYGIAPVFIAAINKQDIIEIIGKNLNGDFVICDRNQIPFLATSDKDYSVVMQELNFGREMKSVRQDGMMITYENMDTFGWNYSYMIQMDRYLQETRNARYIMLINIFICLLVGLVLSIYFSKKNNSSIFQLVKKLEKSYGAEVGNEYVYIERAIDKILEQSTKNDSVLYKQNREMGQHILERILLGEPVSEENVLKLSSFGIEFSKEYFMTLLIDIEEYDQIFFEENNDLQHARQIANVVVSNVCEELLNEKTPTYLTNHGRYIICIINLSDDSVELRNTVLNTVRHTQELIAERFNIGFVVGTSDIHETLMGLSACYAESLKAIEYKLICSDEQVLDFVTLDQSATANYYYPFEKEQAIINNIREGDFERTKQIIEDVLEMNLSHLLSLDLMKCLIFDIFSTFIKTVNELSRSSERLFSYNDFYSHIVSCNSIETVKEELFNMLKTVCNQVGDRRQNTHGKLAEKIKAYVDENYTNPMINVSAIAQEFEITTSFLSTLFKRNEGVGLLEYLTRKRLEEAKRLIENTGIPIEEIAERAGFMSKRTFFRTFTRYEGMPPGKFRK